MRRLALALALSVMLAAGPTFAQQTPAAPAAPAPAPAPAVQVPLQAPAVVEPFPAGVKYAFVNVQRIANESAAGKVATAQVNALVQKKQAESAERTKTLQAAQQKLDAGGTVLSDAARAQLQKEIERQSIDIQRFTEDAQQEVQQLQQQLQLEFQQRLSPVIEAVAKERELHMIFSVVDSGLVWGHASLDLTTEVIQKFDAQPAARPAAQAPAAPAQPRPAAPAPRPAAPAPATPR